MTRRHLIQTIGLFSAALTASATVAVVGAFRAGAITNGISATGGSSQTTAVGTAFATPLQVTVFASGAPVVGATVTFSAPSSGASGVFSSTNTRTATATTNTTGVATAPTFTANDTAGTYSVSATTSSVSGTAYFNLTNSVAGVPASIEAVSGIDQSTTVGTTYGSVLEARVTDANDNPVQGVAVTFSVASTAANGAGGDFIGAGASLIGDTDSDGVATSPQLQANDVSGTFAVTATVQGLSTAATYSLDNLAAAPASVAPGDGSSQEASVCATFTVPLSVTVTDAHDNLVNGAAVTFSAPPTGASGAFSSTGTDSVAVETDASGIAVAPSFRANDTAGGYIVTASVGGVSTPTSFSLVNVAGSSTACASPSTSSSSAPASVGMSRTSTGKGYWLVAADGGIFSFGDAHFYGSEGATHLNAPIVGMAATATGKGYWLVAADGGIFSFGDAHFYGSEGATHLNAPIVGMAATATGKGYWLVAADGGIFSFGDAHFYGSEGATHLNAPIVGMAATATGGGYWLVAADGGIFSFGDAKFYGSEGATHLNAPIVGMAATATGGGYWLVAADGGIFSFGDAKFYGSEGATHLNAPIVGMAATATGGGYWLVAADGGIFSFGDAAFAGSRA